MDPRFILSIVCMIVGCILALGSLYLVFKQQPVIDQHGNVTEVQLPVFGRLKTNYPSLVAFFIAAFLVLFPLYRWPSTSRIPVSGKVTLPAKGSYSGIMVGIVPGNLVPLHDDGTYDLEVLDGEHTYTGVAYAVVGDGTKDVYLGGVSVTKGKGRFDAVLGRQP